MIKEKYISELILKHKLLKERFIEIQCFQEKSRQDLKTYENLNKRYTKNKYVERHIRYLEQIIFENKVGMRSDERFCFPICLFTIVCLIVLRKRELKE